MIPKLNLKAYLFVCLATVMLAVASCKKEEKEPSPQATIENYDKMVRYLSVTLNVAEDKVKFDVEKQEFYVPNTEFRASLKDIKYYYDNANEYKLKYE